MDQLKQAGRFVWKHRFWFSLGLVVIIGGLTFPSGTRLLMMKTNARRAELDGIYSNVSNYASGQDHPNTQWVEAGNKKVEELTKSIDDEWVKNYLEQIKLMTWPTEVAAKFKNRPFMSDLSDEGSQHLTRYRQAFHSQVRSLFDQLNWIGTVNNKVVGILDNNQESVINSAKFDRPPTSKEAWMAQEELWIEGAVVRAINRANKEATGWKDASIKKLLAIGIGYPGLDLKTLTTKEKLISGIEEEAAVASSMGGKAFGLPGALSSVNRGTNNIDPERYLEKNEKFREVPVFVSVLVDQRKIPEVLAAFANMEFRYHINQVSMGVPEHKVEIPYALREVRQMGESGVRDDAVFNTWQLDVWGQMRLYESPPVVEERRKANLPLEGAPPAPATAAVPNPTPATPPADPSAPVAANPAMPADPNAAAPADPSAPPATKPAAPDAAPATPADPNATPAAPATPADPNAAPATPAATTPP